jgi:hypothetical protein
MDASVIRSRLSDGNALKDSANKLAVDFQNGILNRNQNMKHEKLPRDVRFYSYSDLSPVKGIGQKKTKPRK